MKRITATALAAIALTGCDVEPRPITGPADPRHPCYGKPWVTTVVRETDTGSPPDVDYLDKEGSVVCGERG